MLLCLIQLQAEVLLNVDLILGKGLLFHLAALNCEFLRAFELALDASDVVVLQLAFHQHFVLRFLLFDRLRLLKLHVFFLEVFLQILHPHSNCISISLLGHVEELDDLVNVSLDFDQLLGRLGLVRIFGSLLVNKLSDLSDISHDLVVNGFTHEVLSAFGGLQLEDALFFNKFAAAVLDLLKLALQVFDLQILGSFNMLQLVTNVFGLQLVILPLLDEGEVLLLQLDKVRHQVIWAVKGQAV